MLGNFWDGFGKKAFDASTGAAGAIGGAVSGYHSGRSAAGTTANALSRHGYKTKNEETARNVAKVTGALGAVGGLALGLKHKDKLIALAKKHVSSHPDMHQLYHAAVPFLGGTAGGAAAGVATGAATSLRGSFGKHHEKAASKVLKGLAAGLLGTADFGAETLARKAGTQVRRAAAPALTAAGTAVGVNKLHDKKVEAEKHAGITNLIPGVKDMRRGYRTIDKLVHTGHLMPDGTAVSALAAGRKALAGKAMAHGALKTTATGIGAYHLLKKKEPNAG